MTKKKLLIRGVAYSYGAVIAQIFYSFASIPLALSYLTKAEFGLWSLITTITGYLMLAELGVTNAVTRHLLECKGEGDREKYGRLFGGSALALGLISAAVLIVGLILAQYAWRLFPVPESLVQKSILLIGGQSILMSLGMATQVLGAPLYVNHRQDLSQIRQIGQFVILFLVLRWGFQGGWGIYAMLANQAAGFAWCMAFNVCACYKLKFYPSLALIAFPLKIEWASIWKYAKDVFMVQIGSLVLSSLPQLMIVRLLGLEAGATWSVCTRPFAILRQVVGRPFDIALPMLYDNYIAGNMKSVTERWSQLSQGVLAISGVVFAVAAANNAVFVGLWTGGRIHWESSNHWMLALHFFVITAAGLASGSLGMNKTIGKVRFIGFVQVLVTVGIAILAARWYGSTGLILAITIPYLPGLIFTGVRYLGRITGSPVAPLLWQGIMRPALATPLCCLAAWLCSFSTAWLPGFFGLLLSASLGTLAAVIPMAVLGISPMARTEALNLGRRMLRIPGTPASAKA